MQKKAIEEVISSLTLTKEQLLGVAERFVEGKGLANLPSYIYVDREPREGKFVVLEMGGTYLRAAKVKLEVRNEKLKIQYLSEIIKDKIPCREEECSIGDYYKQIIEKFVPILEQNAQIGFTFAYAIEITPEVDGRLLYWTKEIKAPGMVGRLVGAEFGKALRRAGFGECRVVVLNDTVATLLAGLTRAMSRSDSKAKRPTAYDALLESSVAGLVVGTGMNIAVVRDGEVVNTEAAGLDIKGLGVQTEFDRLVDSRSLDPGKAVFEKMIAGMYLPRIFNEIVREEKVMELREFRDFRGEDARIAQALFKRSAQLIGAVVAGAVRLSQGSALNNSNIKGWTFYVVAEGSVFWKVPGYKEIVGETVRELVSGVEVEFVKVGNPGLVGAAIAVALTA